MDQTTENAVRSFLAIAGERYDIAGARLFGSRARGDQSPTSDADLAVFLRGGRGDLVRSAMDMAEIAFDAMLTTGILVTPLPIWLDEWTSPELYGNLRLLENIAREGVEI